MYEYLDSYHQNAINPLNTHLRYAAEEKKTIHFEFIELRTTVEHKLCDFCICESACVFCVNGCVYNKYCKYAMRADLL